MDPALLKLAFALYIAQQVVEADGRVEYGELRMWHDLFPRALLREAGFIDEGGGFTASWESHRLAALTELPKLPETERLELLTLLHGTSLADGEIAAQEVVALRRGADLLAVSEERFTVLLAQLTAQHTLGLKGA